ncbi:hypothetical protein NL676_027992 [Syzygium grande]|nr:hypothetical protein NL676_027992 [Syzygium grande]
MAALPHLAAPPAAIIASPFSRPDLWPWDNPAIHVAASFCAEPNLRRRCFPFDDAESPLPPLDITGPRLL